MNSAFVGCEELSRSRRVLSTSDLVFGGYHPPQSDHTQPHPIIANWPVVTMDISTPEHCAIILLFIFIYWFNFFIFCIVTFKVYYCSFRIFPQF